MKRFSVLIFMVIKLFLLSDNLFALETLSYSGRLVQTNGSPVAGPVTLRAELAYTNALATVLCTEDIPSVTLTKGVFHIKLNLDCSASGLTLTQVLSQVPNGESVAIRITDITNIITPISYNFQALHAIPFANVASQLVQMGATNDQVLKWNNTTKKWEPGSPGGGGTVTTVSGTLPISVANGTSTPVVSISQANSTTNGYLSSTDWNTFNNKQNALPGGGNTTHYLRGDSSWQTLNTDAVTEGTNQYHTGARVLATPITAPTLTNASIATSDTVQVAFGKLQAQFNNILSLALSGLSTATNAAITASDTIISAFGKLQKQITDLSGDVTTLSASNSNKLNKNTADSITATITVSGAGDVIVPSTPAGMTSAVNKTYVDDRIANANNQWGTDGTNVYRTSGNVGVGTSAPTTKLDVRGNLQLHYNGSNNVGLTYFDQLSSHPRMFQYDGVSGNPTNLIRTGGDSYFNGGNVGIGTSSPTQALHVAGNVQSNDTYFTSVVFADGWAVGDYAEIVQSGAVGGAGSSGLYKVALSATRGNWVEASTFTTLTSHADSDVWREIPASVVNYYTTYSYRCFTVDANTGSTAIKFRVRAIRPSSDCSSTSTGSLPIYFKISSEGYSGGWTALSATGTGATVTGYRTSVGSEWNLYTGASRNAGLATITAKDGMVGIGTSAPTSILEIVTPINNGIRIGKSGDIWRDAWVGLSNGVGDGNEWMHVGGHTTSGVRRSAYFASTHYFTGNVGIGTTTPNNLLSVHGSEKQIRIQDTDDATGVWAIGTIGADNRNLNFIDDNINIRMTIHEAGNVGIGTTSPSYKLDVQGGDINASGSVRAAGVALTSDIRYKENIAPLENVLEKILKIRGVSYNWKAEEFPEKHFNERRQVGVIAQEVERQFPEVVDTNKDGFKSVNYPALVAPLIEAVRALYNDLFGVKAIQLAQTRQIASKADKEEIKALKEENIRIKSENAEIKLRLEKIEKMLKAR